MSKTIMVFNVVLGTLVLVWGQEPSQDAPLGELARLQRKFRLDGALGMPPRKVYTNADVVSDPIKDSVNSSATSKADLPKSSVPQVEMSAPAKKAELSAQSRTRSVLDRDQEPAPDAIMVPAGTEIRVDVAEGKVVLPVRVGFSTPIPALSKVTLQVSRAYTSVLNASNGAPNVDYLDYARATAVTVGDTTYEVTANSVPLLNGAANKEVTFVLSAPILVLR